MSGGIIPKQIEYVIARPSQKRWHRAAVLAAAVGVVVLGAVFTVRHYTEPHKYPVLQLPAVGLEATLRTKWMGSSGQYVFQVKPTPGDEARFVSVIETVPHDQLGFDIDLLDADGFELCNTHPKMQIVIASEGKPSAMTADQTFPRCTENQLRAASRWHVGYRFPRLGANIAPPTAVSGTSDASQNTELTGADFNTGEVETVGAGSFKVIKSAEYMTLLGWRSPDEIGLVCRGPVCLLINFRTGEMVHARRH
jgi:hypothetical protein